MSSECFIAPQSDKLSDLSTVLYRIARNRSSDKDSGMGKKAKKLDPYRVLVGSRLTVVRQALNLKTKQDAADLLGVTHDTWSAWEKGANLFPPVWAAFLEERYRIKMAWIYSKAPDRMALELAA